MPILADDQGDRGPYGSELLDGFGSRKTTAPPFNWLSGDSVGITGGTQVLGGVMTRQTAGGYRQGNNYGRGGSTVQFGGGTQAMEAWVQFISVASVQEFAFVTANDPTNANGLGSGHTGYFFGIDWSTGAANPNIVCLRFLNGGVAAVIYSSTSISVAPGDSFGFVLIPSGSNMICETWKKSVGGSWTKVQNGTDTSPITSAQSFVLQFAGGTGFQVAHFGGGNVTIPSSGNDYNENPADSVTLSDAVTFDLVKAAVDTVSLADALAKDFGKLLADTLGIADLASTAKDVPLAPADSVTMSDNAATELGKNVNPADSVTISDAQTFDRGLGVADSVGLADAVVFDRSILLSDSVSVADLATFARELLFGDTLGLSDNAQTLISKNVQVDDSVSVSDDLQRVLDYVRTHSDSVTPSDSAIFAKTIPLAPADSVTVSDNAITGKAYERQFDDTLGLADLAITVVDRVINVNDTLPLTDSAVFSRGMAVEDALTLQDALERSYGLSAADTLALADLADPVLETSNEDYVLNFDDSVTVADALTFIRGVLRTESVAVSDRVERRLNGVLLEDGTTAVLRRGVIYIGRF